MAEESEAAIAAAAEEIAAYDEPQELAEAAAAA